RPEGKPKIDELTPHWGFGFGVSFGFLVSGFGFLRIADCRNCHAPLELGLKRTFSRTNISNPAYHKSLLAMATSNSIFTIGHSTRTAEQFISLLKSNHVQALADVRTVPKSLRVPQFNVAVLASNLRTHGIKYHSLTNLGGWRKAQHDSINSAWRNASFRGYADYMQTPQFETALNGLMALSADKITAIMCAEAVPWRCHRSLIADALTVRGWTVLDIINDSPATVHQLTPFAHVQDHRITYPKNPNQ